jgi:hypothetical protein
MQKLSRFLPLYIIVYFIVDFTTGFNWDFNYWISVGGPVLGAVFYSLTGLLFYYLIYKKKITERTLLLVTAIYGLVLETAVFRNSIVLNFPNTILGVPIVIAVYALIVFSAKWAAEKSLRKNIRKLMPLLAVWIVFAIIAFFMNPHKT